MPSLLDLDRGSGLLELRLDGFRLVAGNALLDRLGGAVHEVLRLLEAEVRERAHDLDHLDLLVARTRKHDVEGGLLLRRRCGSVTATWACARRGDGHRRRGGHAPTLLGL